MVLYPHSKKIKSSGVLSNSGYLVPPKSVYHLTTTFVVSISFVTYNTSNRAPFNRRLFLTLTNEKIVALRYVTKIQN